MKNVLAIAITVAAFITARAQDSLNVHLLYHWNDTTLVGSNAYNNTYNEVWGFVQGGREYAVIGSTMGTHIFDVTSPTNATLVDFVPGAVQGGTIVHRDFHDYNGYLYTASDEGASTLQILDLSYLPDSVHMVYDSPAIFSRAHNIFIDTSSARLYQCGGNGNNGLTVIDISNPNAPVELIDYSSGYVHDVYVRNDTVYANQGYAGFFVYDFTDVYNPQLISSLTSYPQQGYNHSGWLNDDGSMYIMSDETHGMDMKLLDVSDLSNISLIDTIGSEVHPLSIPHNQMIKGNKIFTSYYYDGLFIFNISDPQNPFIDGFYDTSTIPNSSSYEGAWGVYAFLPSGIVLVSDMQNGLYVFDVSDLYVGDAASQPGPSKTVVFPNPFVDHFTLSIAGFSDSGIEDYRITNTLGDVVAKGQITSSLTDIILSDALDAGIYLLQLKGKYTDTYKKLLKVE